MPEYNEDGTVKDNRPCSAIKYDLIECLKATECVRIKKISAKECVRTGDIPQECIALRTLFFECKRSLLDNRQRFRGRKGC